MKKSIAALVQDRFHARALSAALLAASLAIGCGGGGGGGGIADEGDKPLPIDTAIDSGGPGGAGSGTLWISWRAPTQRENGEPLALAQMDGYVVYWGHAGNPTENAITVSDPAVTTYQIGQLAPGTYEVAVTALDTDGLESVLSNSMTKSIN